MIESQPQVEWEYVELLVVEDGRSGRVLLNGSEIAGRPEQILADLWEGGWERDVIWYRDIDERDGPCEVFHQARLRRRKQAD